MGFLGDMVFGFGVGQVGFLACCVGHLGSLYYVRAWGIRFGDLGGGLGLVQACEGRFWVWVGWVLG